MFLLVNLTPSPLLFCSIRGNKNYLQKYLINSVYLYIFFWRSSYILVPLRQEEKNTEPIITKIKSTYIVKVFYFYIDFLKKKKDRRNQAQRKEN